jgi:predicted anti-sigma-YlaC factor YlaD
MTSSPFDTGVLGGRPCPRADERLTALADGELAPHEAERVLAHVAGCPDCRSVLDAERRTKALLAALPMPTPDPMLMARLLEIPRTSFLAPVPLPVARQRNTARRMATLSVAASAAAVVTLGAGWVIGGSSSGGGGGPSVVPAAPALYQEHVATTAQLQLLPEALPLTPFVQSVSNR